MQPSGSASAALLGRQVAADADRVRGGHGDHLRESAGQPGDAVLGVALALVRVAGRAVLAARLAMLAHAGPPLIDDDPIADADVADSCADLLHHAGDLVPEDLRMRRERERRGRDRPCCSSRARRRCAGRCRTGRPRRRAPAPRAPRAAAPARRAPRSDSRRRGPPRASSDRGERVDHWCTASPAASSAHAAPSGYA